MKWWPFGSGNSSGNNGNGVSNSHQENKIESAIPTEAAALASPEPEPAGSTTKEIKSFLHKLTPADFTPANLLAIPCFREAGMSGFTCLFVFSSVMFVYHKNVARAANWGFGGLLLGSIFGWEQCNNVRRKGQMAVKLAQERFEQKTAGTK
ncbi:Cox20 protein [Martiniozyma asiatica (nom. inval.)]|nr:Cox20 protein [Martiniozyma asiatica]